VCKKVLFGLLFSRLSCKKDTFFQRYEVFMYMVRVGVRVRVGVVGLAVAVIFVVVCEVQHKRLGDHDLGISRGSLRLLRLW